MFKFRRRETPWEVVDSEAVETVPMFYEDEDLDIAAVHERDTEGAYVFEGNHPIVDLERVVAFARQQLVEEIRKKGYNILLLEGWQLTTYRRGFRHRVEVNYRGRPALALGKMPKARPPPFIEVLHTLR